MPKMPFDWFDTSSRKSNPAEVCQTMEQYATSPALNCEEVSRFSAVTRTLADKWAEMSLAEMARASKGGTGKSPAEEGS
jgi:hypothetical protein